MEKVQIKALSVALVIAKYEAQKFNTTDDGGTSNMDTPVIFLPEWSESAINEAFKETGLVPSKHGSAIFILRACEGQGYRRTAMAEAFRDSLKASGYNSAVDYRMD